MKRLIHSVARLYPKAWRARYGDEFEALLEDVSPGWRPLFDLAWTGFKMQLQTWTPGKIVALSAVIGGIIGFGLSAATPKQYVSSAVIQIVPKFNHVSATDQSVGEHLNRITRSVLSEPKLAHIIETFGLYESERNREPLDQIVETMKSAITVRLARRKENANSTFAIQFAYRDPAKAQHVTGALMESFAFVNVNTAGPGDPWVYWKLMGPPNLPKYPFRPHPWALPTLGAAAGTLFGLLLAVLHRSPKPV